MMPFSWLGSEVNGVASRSDAASLSPKPLYNGLITIFLIAIPFRNECQSPILFVRSIGPVRECIPHAGECPDQRDTDQWWYLYGLRLHAMDGGAGFTELSDIWYFPILSGLFREYVLGRRPYLALG
jgi:hypothetical protein